MSMSVPDVTPGAQRSEFREHWRLLLATVVGIGTSLTTLVSYTSGVLLPSLSKDFGWSDPQILAAIAIVLFGASALGPVIGMVADRYGPRRVILSSLAASGLAWMLLALGTGSLAVYYGCFVALTIAGCGTLPVTWTRGLIQAFQRGRGMALGLAMVGTGIFGTAMKFLVFAAITHAGWRSAYVAIGLFVLIVVLPIAFFGYREPVGRGADGAGEAAEAQAGLTVSEAMRTSRFWLLCASFLLLSLALAGLAPNLERFITHWGFDMATAVNIASMFGVGIIVGRLMTGWLLDRIWAPLVVLMILLPGALVYVLLAFGPWPEPVLFGAIALFGAATGAEYDALAYLVSRYFGLRAYSAIYGCIYIGFAIGAGLGPSLFAGAAAAIGYPALMIANAGLLCVGAGLLLCLGRYPNLSTEGQP